MKAIIIGAGEVGYHISDHLSRTGHDVTVIERNPEKQRLLKEKVNALVVVGNGLSASTLREAGAEGADIFIAVTNQDEVNLVACLLARQFHIPRTIARVKNLDYTRPEGPLNEKTLGIDLLINPESVVAREIYGLSFHSGSTEVAEFADGRVIFLGLQIGEDNPVAGVSLRDLGDIRGVYRLVVTAITRLGETIIPHGDDVIQPGDTIYFVCNKSDLNSINYLFGIEKSQSRKVFVLGGGRVGHTVARRLAEEGCKVKVIDRNPDHCRDLANRLDNVLILCADGTDVDTLRNEGIADGDVYIAVTQDDTSNILLSLLAKQYGVKRAVALVNSPALLNLAPTLGVDACISPRVATASAILKYLRKGDVLNVTVLDQSNAEVTETIVPSGSPILNKPLKNLRFPRGAIIGAVVRGPDVFIPTGEDHLEAGDHVIAFTLPGSVTRVEKFFA